MSSPKSRANSATCRSTRKRRRTTTPSRTPSSVRPPVPFALGIGGNLGDVPAEMAAALAALAGLLGSLRIAPLFRGAAVPAGPQPPFFNSAVAGATDLPSDALLAQVKRLELLAGRRPGPRNAPRPLDIDLLVYGDERRDTPELTLPHPRLRQRRFALAPLASLRPDLRLPPDGAPVATLLAACAASPPLERLAWPAAIRRELAALATLVE